MRVLEDCQQTDNVEYGTELILPVKLFTAFSPTTMSRLHAICQTPTLTEPVKKKKGTQKASPPICSEKERDERDKDKRSGTDGRACIWHTP